MAIADASHFAERREKFLLHGPQLAGGGVDQAKVDEMFP